MVDRRLEHSLCLEPMVFTPFYRLVGKGKDGPYYAQALRGIQ